MLLASSEKPKKNLGKYFCCQVADLVTRHLIDSPPIPRRGPRPAAKQFALRFLVYPGDSRISAKCV